MGCFGFVFAIGDVQNEVIGSAPRGGSEEAGSGPGSRVAYIVDIVRPNNNIRELNLDQSID